MPSNAQQNADSGKEVKKSFYTTVDHPFDIKNVEEVDCNYCGSSTYRSLGDEVGFDIRECAECGLVYVSPQPTADEIPSFYENMYLDDSPTEVAARGLGYTERQLRRIIVRRKPEGGRLLDIGCGFGAVLGEMDRVEGWEISGIEIGEKAVDHLRQNVPSATIHKGTLDDHDFETGSFDCILMITVLEHVKDPARVLERVSRWLAPGGLLVLQVPHIAPFIRMKRFWPGMPIYFETPRHLFDFSPKTLNAYYRRAGYSDVRIDVALPYACGSWSGLALIWGVKAIGILLHKLTFGRYLFPFSGGIVAHGIKRT